MCTLKGFSLLTPQMYLFLWHMRRDLLVSYCDQTVKQLFVKSENPGAQRAGDSTLSSFSSVLWWEWAFSLSLWLLSQLYRCGSPHPCWVRVQHLAWDLLVLFLFLFLIQTLEIKHRLSCLCGKPLKTQPSPWLPLSSSKGYDLLIQWQTRGRTWQKLERLRIS